MSITARRLTATLVLPALAATCVSACTKGDATPKKSASSRTQSACPTPLPSPTASIAVSGIHVNVFNASGKDRFASDIAAELKWRGFQIISEGNDPNPDNLPVPKWAQIRFGPGGRQIALTLAAQVQNAELHEDKRADPSVDLVLGSSFAMVPVPPPAASTITVNVYNTTFRAGLATTVANALKARQFKVATTGNDPQHAFLPNDVVLVRYGVHGDGPARRVAAQFPEAKLSYDPNRTDPKIDVVVGNKYQALKPTAQSNPAPWKPMKPTGCS